MKIDLHCHSKCSRRPTLWVMQKLGCPESYTEPRALYDSLRRKGMGAVTITDHNTIEGCLEIDHLPNTFISCEYTTYFPEDHCKVHVLAYDITEAQHEVLSEARENIFDFVECLRRDNIFHVCAHPLFWINDRLTLAHVEKLVLLFKNWEVNGDMAPALNAATMRLITRLSPELIARLSEQHRIVADYGEPWKKNITAGSDDHSSLNLGRAYTEVRSAETFLDFRRGVEQGRARVRIRPATPQGFARNVYGIAYQFYRNKLKLDRYVNKDLFLRFLDHTLRSEEMVAWSLLSRLQMRISQQQRGRQRGSSSLLDLARREAEKQIRGDSRLMRIVYEGYARESNPDAQWFEFADAVANKVLVHFARTTLDKLTSAKLLDLFHSAGSAGALYFLLAPYFVGYSLYGRQSRWAGQVEAHFAEAGGVDAPPQVAPRIGHFTDTFHEVNGVALTLRQHVASARKLGKHYQIISCAGREGAPVADAREFTPIERFTLPEYSELELLVPPFLQMLEYCQEEDFTHLHLATPGPVGLAGLAIARILKLPVAGTYHTAFPQYAKALTEDSYMEDIAWRYMVWFYDQLDAVYVPSMATGRELIARGVSEDKIRVYPRGVDTERFHPRHRNGYFEQRHDLSRDETLLLYVGRVSKEKNLHVLVKAYRVLVAQGVENVRLVVAGDGPYRQEMERALEGLPVLFAGYVQGPDLAALYASSDLLVFPSTTDTFGNVVLEAQASGLPVIVTDEGGPHENVLPGETGIIVRGHDPASLAEAMRALAANPEKRRAMGAAAREYAASRGFESAFEQLWEMLTTDDIEHGDVDDPLSWLKAASHLPLAG